MPGNPSALSVVEIGSFFVGGRIHHLEGLAKRERISTPGGPVHFIDPNGELMAGQMYVQYVRLARPGATAPLLMWHGGGMTGVNWETTPDGRPGWQMFFPYRKARHGRSAVPVLLFVAQRLGGVDSRDAESRRSGGNQRYRLQRKDHDKDCGNIVDAYSIEHTVHSTQCSRA